MVAAQVHHVVGGDRGWERSTDLASWFAGRDFRVGDIIWFAYSAAQESVVELKTPEEFMSCDLSNPIRMYNGGLDKIPLQREGIRYFASGNPESCQKGLKLPVDVQNGLEKQRPGDVRPQLLAAPPQSASAQLTALSSTLFVGLVVHFCFGL